MHTIAISRFPACLAAMALLVAGCDRAEQSPSDPVTAPAAAPGIAPASDTASSSAPASSSASASASSAASGSAPPSAAVPDPRSPISVRPPDAFYDAPTERPEFPGVLLRTEPLANVTLPAGMRGWRILYTTSIDDRTPATAVATVFAPAAELRGPRPLIAWAHGSTGLLQKCMPSLASAPSEGIPARELIVEAGYVVVATDYAFAEPGGPHPYLIGQGEARSVLDSVRAARQMSEIWLDLRTVVWGHSQGGHAALWTGIIGADYAPEVEIAGVAAIAPAADIAGILALSPDVERRLGPYIARAYSRFYADIAFEQALSPAAQDAARQIVDRCGFLPPEDPVQIAELTAGFAGPALTAPGNPALAARLAANRASRPIGIPLVVAQGSADTVVLPAATDVWVEERCSAGQPLEHWSFEGLDHGTIVRPGTPLAVPLIAWTAARFAGEPPAAGCTRQAFRL
jgi:alpha-beta hydrolase superfamily lysophospholipase